MFQITITAEAELHLLALSAREQRIVRAAVEARLIYDPTVPTNAIKKLRPNPLAGYELRVRNLRVLYNVEGNEVVLLLVGRKIGNSLIVKGEKFHGHQNNPSKPTRDEPTRDT
jgi:mRNA-degrading endonuclease RelE of RelBE toxin-antitoxin system